MRKFWIVLLSIALIMAFTLPAAAADVKFSGEYKVQGVYDNNRKLSDPAGTSVSDVFQRLRVGTTFKVAEGLSLTTRFDALEKVWGAARTAYTTANTPNNVTDSENISFEQVYVTFNTAVGKFDVGYQTQNGWGTSFMDSTDSSSGARIKYTLVTGPLTWLALWDKVEGYKAYNAGGPAGTVTPPSQVDSDYNGYAVAGIYNWDKGNAGLLLKYVLKSDTSGATVTPDTGYKAKWYLIDPYIKATFGPVYLEADFMYRFGKSKEWEQSSATQVDIDFKNAWSAYIMANVNLAPAYVGALAFYVSGDDPSTTDKDESGYPSGTDFSPCLILMNYDIGRFNGAVGNAYNSVSVSNNISNILAGQLFAGIKPIPKLDVRFSITTAKLNEELSATTPLVSKNLGYEADLTATYKIYDNLEYMIGFGYLWAGDAFKGYSSSNKVDNDYLVTHKLSLVF